METNSQHKPAGRPPLPDDVRRDERYVLTLNRAERDALNRAARRAGFGSAAQYIRARCIPFDETEG